MGLPRNRHRGRAGYRPERRSQAAFDRQGQAAAKTQVPVQAEALKSLRGIAPNM